MLQFFGHSFNLNDLQINEFKDRIFDFTYYDQSKEIKF